MVWVEETICTAKVNEAAKNILNEDAVYKLPYLQPESPYPFENTASFTVSFHILLLLSTETGIFQTGVGVMSLVEGGMKISGNTYLMNNLYASRLYFTI